MQITEPSRKKQRTNGDRGYFTLFCYIRCGTIGGHLATTKLQLPWAQLTSAEQLLLNQTKTLDDCDGRPVIVLNPEEVALPDEADADECDEIYFRQSSYTPWIKQRKRKATRVDECLLYHLLQRYYPENDHDKQNKASPGDEAFRCHGIGFVEVNIVRVLPKTV